MDETWTLILLSLAMLIGCYLAGSIPLAISLSESKLKLVTILGAGLLVGTALAVIIPEGIHALTAHQGSHSHDHNIQQPIIRQKRDNQPLPIKPSPSNPLIQPNIQQRSDQNSDHHHDHDHHDHEAHLEIKETSGNEHGSHSEKDVHSYIGVALVLGFVFMLLVDQIGGSHNFSSSSADGIALGAAASTSQMHVEMIVFVAIMLHKAPAAFGLVSFLLHEGFDRNRIRKHLAVFALSAPVLAVLTYFGLGQKSKEALSEVNATGLAMLFSGGTFLYVATVHILPELSKMGSSGHQLQSNILPENMPGSSGSITINHYHHHSKGFNRLELTVMVVGCLLPLILALGHHH
ncbi:hypothetical protein HELRODRAFT_167387 [Helobdella robusta]|uniref:Uncharacterized protein n=1 Tax=Helobdella robusta TaxID=6412 RepID=T1EZC0_HELRO|nr:hypothetical protein HELRODRAFT_167387 [Helobdella robusta]ESO10875.1 hypothetical protein HELRODRAFT_167387 [Helobdella robusta]